jgi:TPP-dependent pyruvate/acetoin dehydrogenase alpha subunit
MKLTNKIKIHLYKEMLRIRKIEEAIAKEYSAQEMRCPVHLSIGQEAIAVGVSAHLSKHDLALSAHRSHAHYLAKGGNLKSMLSELYGKETGCAKGKGGSMHLFDLKAGLIAAVPIVGSTLPIGVGVAWNMARKQIPGVVVIYFGDGATEEGVFSESLDFASLKNLPVLFVCENNLYSVYTPIELRQNPLRQITKIAEAHGITSKTGDGNRVEEVYAFSGQAIEYIQKNKRPYLLELFTYRWLEHCGPNWDDHLGYRKKDELKYWMAKCPLKRCEKNIKDEKIINDKDLETINEEVDLEIREAFNFAKSSSLPNSEALFEHVYA